MREVLGIHHLGDIRQSVEVVTYQIETLQRLTQLLEARRQLNQSERLYGKMLEISQLADVLANDEVVGLWAKAKDADEILKIVEENS